MTGFNRHYLVLDEGDRIIWGWSDGPDPTKDPSNAVLLREDGGYQFQLFPDGEVNPRLTTEEGIPIYRYADGQVVLRSEAEIEAERSTLPKAPDSPKTTEELEKENNLLKAQIQALSERSDFIEDCIAEMAGMVYG